MRKRGVVGVTVAWLLTVAAVSALTWSVISVAGSRVGRGATAAPATAPGTPQPSQQAQSWHGPGGRVMARCSGNSITLGSAVPDVGYSVDVKARGPQRLRLDFEPTEEGEEVRLTATCLNGVPRFSRD